MPVVTIDYTFILNIPSEGVGKVSHVPDAVREPRLASRPNETYTMFWI